MASFAYALAVALTSLIAVGVVLRVWHLDLGIPITGYASDGIISLVIVKDILEHGWFLTNPDVAAPFGQTFYDGFASGDNLQFALLKGLGAFSASPAVVVNLYFLLTFPVVALLALFCLRRLGLSRPAAAVAALLFTFMPYHFVRGLNGHLFLAAYYSVPLGCYLVLSVLAGDSVFELRAARGRWSRLASGKSLLAFGFCLVIGSCGLYYAVFTAMLLTGAAVLALLTNQRRAAAGGAVCATLILGILAFNLAPSIAYRATHGPNPEVGQRAPAESETYATKLTHLVLPVTDDRIAPLARLKARYEASAPPPFDYGVSLGIIGTFGLVTLVLTALLSCVATNRTDEFRRLRHASAVTVFSLLLITAGGISSLIAYILTPQIRGWYRESIFIAFLAVFAVGMLLDALARRIGTARGRRIVIGGLAAGLLMFGLFEQTTNGFIPNYAQVKAQWQSDGAFVDAIDQRLAPRAEVFQLPYTPFPEWVSANGGVDAYTEAIGYLHSDDLRWSWGAMKGRPEDWVQSASTRPLSELLAEVAAAGFTGIYLDRRGYPGEWPKLESRLRGALGVAPLVSRNDQLSFFDLRPYSRRLRGHVSSATLRSLAFATLHPVETRWSDGFYPLEQSSSETWHWAGSAAPRLELVNELHRPRRVRFRSDLQPVSMSPATLVVRWPDGVSETIRLSGRMVHVDRTLRLRAGESTISFETSAAPVSNPPADPRARFFGLVDTRVDPAGITAVAPAPKPAAARVSPG